MLAADAHRELGSDAPALFHRYAHQAADAVPVQLAEGIFLEHTLLDVLEQEFPLGVVARVSEGRLRQVVRPEAEELRVLGQLVGHHGRARHLDHRPDEVGEVRPGGLHDLACDAVGHLAEELHLRPRPHQRNHDLRPHLDACLRQLRHGLEDRVNLHLVDLGVDHPQTAAAEPQHRVGLVQLIRLVQGPTQLLGLRGGGGPLLLQLAQRLQQGRLLGKEFVQWRVEQPDDDGVPIHRPEDPDEIVLLHHLQLVQRRDAFLAGLGHHQPLHHGQAVGRHEHVFRAAEADAPGPELARATGVLWRVRVGPDLLLGRLVRPAQQLLEVLGEGRLDQRRLPQEDAAR